MKICQQPVGSTILTSFTLFKFSGKYKMFGNSQSTMLSCVCQANISIKWLQDFFSASRRLHQERHENCFGSFGRPQGGHAMLTRSVFSSLSTVSYSMNPITCFQLSTDVSVSYTLTRSLEVTTVSQCLTK